MRRCKLGGCDSLPVLQISCMGDPDGFAKGGFVLLDQDFKASPALFQAPHQCCNQVQRSLPIAPLIAVLAVQAATCLQSSTPLTNRLPGRSLS